MTKLFIFLGMSIFGSVGWWLGEHVGVLTALLASGVASLVGVYVGWRIGHDYFE